MRGRVAAPIGSCNLRPGMQRRIGDTTESLGITQGLPAVRSEEEMRNFRLPLTGVKGKKVKFVTAKGLLGGVKNRHHLTD